MDVAAFCLAAGSLAASVVIVVFYERRKWLGRQQTRRVIVHTTEDTSIEGTLLSTTVDGVVLRAAKLLDAQDTPLGGEVFVPARQMHFVQVVPAAET